MRVKRLAHVSLGAPDLDAAIAFFARLLDAPIAHEFRNAAGERYGVFLFTGGESFLELFHEPRSDLDRPSLFRHLCFEVADLEAMASHARALGHAVEIRRGRTDGVLQFFVTGPGGIAVEFQQHDDQSALLPFLGAGAAAVPGPLLSGE